VVSKEVREPGKRVFHISVRQTERQTMVEQM